MRSRFIAVTNEGTEYMYKRSTMIAVPSSSASVIADILTRNHYKIAEGEKWHVYDNDYYTDSFIKGEIRSFRKGHNIKVYSYYG